MPLFTDRPYPDIEGVHMTHRYIDIGNAQLHIAETGEGDPLILLHGWPQHWWMWRRQIPFFEKYFKVIAVDLRGFGWSEVTQSGYAKDDLAEDLKKLIDALGYKSVRLLSHDWGGWIGFIASSKYPGLVSHHFATNICPIWPKISWQMIPATFRLRYMFKIAMPYLGWRMLKRSNKFVRHILIRDRTSGKPWSEYEMNVFSDQFTEEARAKASSRLYGSFLLKEYIPLGILGKYHHLHLKTPTRVLFGKNDFAIALSWLRGYEKYADDIQIELVEGTGHFIVDEQPDLVNQKAFTFFNELKSPS